MSELPDGNNSSPPQQEAPNDGVIGHYIEMWKATVEVQQHFNDLEWRIRGLALTAATFALGASGIAAKEGSSYSGVSIGTCILIVGLILWYGFYFADRYWYHPLLIGSVTHGQALEAKLREWIPEAGLTSAIGEASPQERSKLLLWAPCDKATGKMHSTEKLKAFYMIGAVALTLAAVILQIFAFMTSGIAADPEKVFVVVESPGAPEHGSMLPSAESPTLQPLPTAPEEGASPVAPLPSAVAPTPEPALSP